MAQRFNKIKARQAILYICHKLSDQKTFGGTVLNKVLYYIDHANYIQTGKTLTGFGYIKQVNGPTPNPDELLALKQELMKSGELREYEVQYFGKLQKRLKPPYHPSISCFSGEEIALMDEIIETFSGINATDASNISHGDLSWNLAKQMEELPPSVCLLTESTLNSEDIAWGKRMIRTYLQSHPTS